MQRGGFEWSPFVRRVVTLGLIVLPRAALAQQAASPPASEVQVAPAIADANSDRSSTIGRLVNLFDGSSLDGWRKFDGGRPSPGWIVQDKTLHRQSKAGHLVWSDQEFGDFELSWDWKIAPGGNSGVKYRVANYDGRWLGCEYQLLDDARHPNASDPTRTAGALYNLVAPTSNKRLQPAGQYNRSRVVARGTHLEHWLNGQKILVADTASSDWRRRVAESKFSEYGNFAQNPRGLILLQDHGSDVWFRNIVVRSFDPAPAASQPPSATAIGDRPR
jgi:hypothetical protein